MKLTWLHYLTITLLSIHMSYGQHAPVFNSTPSTSIDEDTSYEYIIDVTDPNGDDVSISVTPGSTLPAGLSLGTTTPSKTVSTEAGSSTGSFMMGYFGGHNDGSAAMSLFNGPGGVAIDASGNLFVADANNHCIRKIATDGTVSTFAGTVTGGFGTAGDVDALGTAAKFNTPTDLVFDANGNLYVTDKGNHKIKRITPAGQVATFVGTGSAGSSNGFGTGASLSSPTAIAIAPNGIFYVADAGNHRIRRISSIGIVSTLAGSSMGYNDDTGVSAQFNQPEGIAVDSDGNIYVADTHNFRIRKITSSGVVTTIAGSGTNTSTDGSGTAATFSQPTGIAVNKDGLIYVSDWLYGKIREIDASNNVTTIAGADINDPMGDAAADGDALSATFYRPNRMTLTSEGHLIIADGNQRIRKLIIDNGDPALTGEVDIPGTYSISITATDGSNDTEQNFDLIVADILSIDTPDDISVFENSTGILHTFTGSGPLAFTFSKSGGADASFFSIDTNTGELSLTGGTLDFENPTDQYVNNTYEVEVTVDDGVNTSEQSLTINVTNVNEATPTLTTSDVDVSIDENESVTYPIAATDADNDNVSFTLATGSTLPPGLMLNQIDETYMVSLFSGNNQPSSGDIDGDASTARFTFNTSTKIIPSKTSTGFLALQSSGFPMAPNVIRTIAADGTAGRLLDNNGSTITLSGIGGIDMNSVGNIYVGDAGSNQIKQITVAGVVSVFSGSGSAFTFDGSSSTAGYQNIKDVAINSAGEIFVAQSTRIRKLEATGAVTTVAGGNAMRVDGHGTSAGFLDIVDIVFDQFDDMYILESSGYVRKMDKSYEVTSIAGGATGSVDGTGTNAGFNSPYGLAVGPDGNLLVGENYKIRKVTTEGIVTTFSGGTTLDQTNGDISVAGYGFLSSIAVSGDNTIYVADWYYHNLREITHVPASASITGAVTTAGNYAFSVTASDGELSVDQSFDLEVADVTTPVFTSATSFNWDENESGTVFTASATDPSTVTFDFDGSGADNDLFSIDGNSGQVSFRSAPDFEDPDDDNVDNDYVIGITASDGTNTATSIITITVDDVTPTEQLTVTAVDQSRTYGSANPTFTVTFDGLTGLDNESDFTVVTSTIADEFSAPDDYDITVSLNLTGRYFDTYTLTTNNGTLTVNKAMLDITAEDQTKTYGDDNPELTVSYSGFINGENEIDLTSTPVVSTSATSTSDAGTYDIQVSGASSDNYEINYTNGSLTINKASLFATIDDQTKVYGDALPTLSISYSGFVGGEDETVLDTPPSLIAYHPVEENFVDETSEVRDDYVINSSSGSDNNYEFIWTLGTLTITKATLSVTANDGSKTYGEANPTLEQTITGFVNGEDESDLTTSPGLTTSANENSAAGSYAITSSGGEADNYEFVYTEGSLTVEKAILSVVAADAGKIYGNSNPAFSQAITGYVNGEDESDLTTVPTVSTSADESSAVGSYAISSSGGEAENYEFEYTEGTMTVEKATLIIVPVDEEKSYGDSNPTFSQTITGYVNGDDDSDLTIVPTISTNADETSSVGIYAISSSGGEADNYSFEYSDGNLTVSKATLTVAANDITKTYGDSNPMLTQTITGYVNSEDETVISTLPTLSTEANESSTTGSYAITSSGGEADNYAFTYNNGTLTIDKAILTVAVDNESKLYGEANPNFSQTIEGFVNDEDETSLTSVPDLSTNASKNSDVGTYTINSSGGEAENYSFDYSEGTLTIEKASLSVTVDDELKTYGDANPSFSVSIEGFVNDEDETALTSLPVASSNARKNSDAGTYAITSSGGEAENYSFHYTEGVLTINRALLTVKASDLSRTYGENNPVLTYTIEGFVNNDNASDLTSLPILSTEATANSNVGEYTIEITSGNDNNYRFRNLSGTLDITKAPLLVTAHDLIINEGDELPTFTFEITGFVNDESTVELDELPVASVEENANLNAGEYEITLSGGMADNYAFEYVSGTLFVEAEQILAVPETIDFEVYPNPVATSLHISGVNQLKDASIYLLDLQGKRIELNTPGKSSMTGYNVSRLKAGIYILIIVQGQDILLKQKLIVTK